MTDPDELYYQLKARTLKPKPEPKAQRQPALLTAWLNGDRPLLSFLQARQQQRAQTFMAWWQSFTEAVAKKHKKERLKGKDDYVT